MDPQLNDPVLYIYTYDLHFYVSKIICAGFSTGFMVTRKREGGPLMVNGRGCKRGCIPVGKLT